MDGNRPITWMVSAGFLCILGFWAVGAYLLYSILGLSGLLLALWWYGGTAALSNMLAGHQRKRIEAGRRPNRFYLFLLRLVSAAYLVTLGGILVADILGGTSLRSQLFTTSFKVYYLAFVGFIFAYTLLVSSLSKQILPVSGVAGAARNRPDLDEERVLQRGAEARQRGVIPRRSVSPRKKARLMRKWEPRFAGLAADGQFEEALTLFEAHLAPIYTSLDPALRATYHCCRWQVFREEADWEALRRAARQEQSGLGQIARAVQALGVLRLQAALVQAIREANPQRLNQYQDHPLLSPSGAPLERLGYAMATALTYRKPDPKQGPEEREARESQNKATLEGARQRLPQFEEIAWPQGQVAWSRLFILVHLILGPQASLLENPHVLKVVPEDARQVFLKYAADQGARQEWPAGDLETAQAALALAVGTNSQAGWLPLFQKWALEAVQAGASTAALAWIEICLAQETLVASKIIRLRLSLLKAVIYLAMNRLAEAQAILDQIMAMTDAHLDSDLADEPAIIDIRYESEYLLALSHLAGTSDWGVAKAQVAEEGQAEETEEDSARRYRVQILWRELHSKLLALVRDLCAGPEPHARRGRLLLGLLQYIETSQPLNLDDISAFSAVAENEQSDTARIRLKDIAGALLTRIRAVDEAVRLIQAGDSHNLAILARDVLEPLAEAVPVFLRAAVIMTLWSEGQHSDPIPALRELSKIPEAEALVNRCLDAVNFGATLRALAAECRRRQAGEQALPALEPLHGNPDALRLGALALAVLQVRDRQTALALETLAAAPDMSGTAHQATHEYLTFHAAWVEYKVQDCQRVLEQSPQLHPRLSRQPRLAAALKVRTMVAELEEGHTPAATAWVREEVAARGWQAFGLLLLAFLVWLLEQEKTAAVRELARLARTLAAEDQPPDQEELVAALWLTGLAEALAAARSGLYDGCMAAVDDFIALAPPEPETDEARAARELPVAWARLLRAEAELAVTAESDDDPASRWPALRRSLEACGEQLRATELSEYADLLSGLVAYLSTDVLVEEVIIARLKAAQDRLRIQRGRAFIQQIIGQLQWRRRIMVDFWESMAGGRFKDSQAIFNKELLPAFGHRMPDSISLGMILADWDANETPTSALIKRLAELEAASPLLDNALIRKVKNYILDGDRIRHLIELLKSAEKGEGDFDKVIDFIQGTEWAGLPKGSMPVAVAIAQLYAYFRKERNEEACNFGAQIRESSRFAAWVHDYGRLLLGYVLFKRLHDYAQAATVFGEIEAEEVLGHAVVHYKAASYFNKGIEFLDADQKDLAFESFKTAIEEEQQGTGGNLVPLFMHFGLKHMEARDGTRALQAFSVAANRLDGDEDNPDQLALRYLVRLAELLCQALLPSSQDEVDGESFMKVLADMQQEPEPLAAPWPARLERLARVLAVCVTLRLVYKYRASKDGPKLKPTINFLEAQAAKLEELSEEQESIDPMLFVLQGMILLRMRGGSVKEVLEFFGKAARLGVQSQSFFQLVKELQKVQDSLKDSLKESLDIFDTYLMSGSVPSQVRDQLAQRDDLGELYQLGRQYAPAQVIGQSFDSGVRTLCNRLRVLTQHVDKLQQGGRDADLDKMVKQIAGILGPFEKSEKKLLELEEITMELIAARLRRESLA